jgi:hypothetical protein
MKKFGALLLSRVEISRTTPKICTNLTENATPQERRRTDKMKTIRKKLSRLSQYLRRYENEDSKIAYVLICLANQIQTHI